MVPRFRKNQLTCVVGAQIPSNTASDHRTESHRPRDHYNFNHTTSHKCQNLRVRGFDDCCSLRCAGIGWQWCHGTVPGGSKQTKSVPWKRKRLSAVFYTTETYKLYYKNTLRSTSETLTRFLIQLLHFLTKNKRTPYVSTTSRPSVRPSVIQY
jgi:hypothetical protein